MNENKKKNIDFESTTRLYVLENRKLKINDNKTLTLKGLRSVISEKIENEE